jgi:hypothetical protein
MPPKQPSGRAIPRLGAVWEKVAMQPPSLDFEPGPPKDCAYDVPDFECDGWSTAELTLRAASVRGDSHRWPKRAKPRQDCARATVHEPTGVLVFAVADGVSGAVRSELGAREACRGAVNVLVHQLSRGGGIDFADVVRHAAERLCELTRWHHRMGRAESPDVTQVSDLFATTLVAGCVRPAPDGAVVDLCRVGDSGAWLLNQVSEPRGAQLYVPLFPSKTGSGEGFVPSRVAALPRIPESLECKQAHLSRRQALLVATDGFSDPLGDGDGAFGALFAEQLRTPPPPLWLAHVLDFSRETFDDDRTLLAVWPRHAGERP